MAEGGTAKGMSPDDINIGTFGHHHFRADQKNIITEALESRDIMVIMPTGGGKSLCYQIPAMCDRGLAVVVTPLLSLAQDQVSSLKNRGIHAKCLNSSQDDEEIQVLSNIFLCGSRARCRFNTTHLRQPSACMQFYTFITSNLPLLPSLSRKSCRRWGALMPVESSCCT